MEISSSEFRKEVWCAISLHIKLVQWLVVWMGICALLLELDVGCCRLPGALGAFAPYCFLSWLVILC